MLGIRAGLKRLQGILFAETNVFPPELTPREQFVQLCLLFIVILDAAYLAVQFCKIEWWVIGPSVCGTYIGLGFLLFALFLCRSIEQKLIIHRARLIDVSVVHAMFVEARTVERGHDKKSDEEREKIFVNKKEGLNAEVERLEKLQLFGWTEYQILSLSQMLVDFLTIDELKARAVSTLDDLREFGGDAKSRYDRDHYDRWEKRIVDASKAIDDCNDRSALDDLAARLRAELQTLQEHVANYTCYWAQGSAWREALMTGGFLAVFILLYAGLLPVLHPSVPAEMDTLTILNWGLLGICGSIAKVLLELKKVDIVEVGNTEGINEVWQAILGTVLGLLAGILSYAMIAGDLIEGNIVPVIESSSLSNTGLSILWAIASGLCFETIFNRVKASTVGE